MHGRYPACSVLDSCGGAHGMRNVLNRTISAGPSGAGLVEGQARRILSVMMNFENACQCQWVF